MPSNVTNLNAELEAREHEFRLGLPTIGWGVCYTPRESGLIR